MRKILDQTLISLLVVFMTIMVLSTLLQVLARMIQLNVPFTEELTVYAMMWVTLFGSAYTFGLRKHIAIDALSTVIPPNYQWRLEIFIEILILIFAILILLVGGSRFVYITFYLNQVSSVMLIPKGWVYLALPLSGILIICYNVLNIIKVFKERNTL